MSAKKILNEDWSDYDNKKIKDKRDSRNFSCSELWEVTYLIGKISKHHPKLPDSLIRTAIHSCCSSLSTPHPRELFVECVAIKLGIPLN